MAYFGIVFALGFILGTIRVLVIVPHTGELLAVLIELPLMLAAAWMVCSALIYRFQVPPRLLDRLIMGFGAFTLLVTAEVLLAVCAFGNSVESVFATYLAPHGLVGLGGQVLFGGFPLLRMQGR